MSENNAVHHYVKTEQQLQSLLLSIHQKEAFADSFQFETESLRGKFLNAAIPENVDFDEKYYFFDKSRNLHIAESEKGFFWISTMGLTAFGKYTENKYVNAFANQKFVLSTLLDAAKMICSADDVYDIDSYHNSQLKILTPAIWQNYVFFFEVFGKAYLSVSGKNVERGHHISEILTEVKNTMFALYQNDTLFHAYVIPSFEELSNHIKKIPGNFKEAFIKYDDNKDDSTCFTFSEKTMNEIRDLIHFCDDFIMDYYYSKDDPLYLKPGLYNRLLEKAPNEAAKKVLEEQYGFLLRKQEDKHDANTGMDRKR